MDSVCACNSLNMMYPRTVSSGDCFTKQLKERLHYMTRCDVTARLTLEMGLQQGHLLYDMAPGASSWRTTRYSKKLPEMCFRSNNTLKKNILKFLCCLSIQLGAATNFDDFVKFGDRHQIRQSQLFIKLAFEFGCDVIFMSHPITRSLGSKLR